MLGPLAAVALFGLGASAAFGTGDYCGGLAGKVNPAERVVAVSHLLTLMVFTALAYLSGERAPAVSDVGWSLAAGVASAVGLLCLYRGLSVGPMGVVAAVSAVLAAAVPVGVAVGLGQVIGGAQIVGFALAMAGVVLLSAGHGGGRGGLPWAIVAGLALGTFLVLVAQSHAGPFATLAVSRSSSAFILVALSLPHGLRIKAVPAVLLAAVCDATGNVFFLAAARTGLLAEAGVLSNLYPAATTLLAWLLLREQLRWGQWAGLALTLAAVPLIAA